MRHVVLDVVISDCVVEAGRRGRMVSSTGRRDQRGAPNPSRAGTLPTLPCIHWPCPAPDSSLEDLGPPVTSERHPWTRE